MKKIILILIISLFLFGCSKKEEKIIINVYNNEVVSEETKEEKVNEVKEDTINSNASGDMKKEKIEVENSVSNITEEENEPKQNLPIENKENSKQNWYTENKDELKNISKEIIEQDKEVISDAITNIKDWYNQNKDELTEISNEIYYEEKETLTDLYNKFKN